MAQITVTKVTVESLTKYGFKANNRFVNYSKQLAEDDKALVVPGATMEVEFYIADSGKEYLNKVVKVLGTESVAPLKPTTISKREFKPKFEKKETATMSKEEWAQKDQRISRQGLLQASFIALAPVVSLENLFKEAVKLADQGFEYVNKQA